MYRKKGPNGEQKGNWVVSDNNAGNGKGSSEHDGVPQRPAKHQDCDSLPAMTDLVILMGKESDDSEFALSFMRTELAKESLVPKRLESLV